jgi:hypothetical protein
VPPSNLLEVLLRTLGDALESPELDVVHVQAGGGIRVTGLLRGASREQSFSYNELREKNASDCSCVRPSNGLPVGPCACGDWSSASFD